ncbi:hypothetical protein GCM10023178_01380 [Actinomadura luteofluorescens]
MTESLARLRLGPWWSLSASMSSPVAASARMTPRSVPSGAELPWRITKAFALGIHIASTIPVRQQQDNLGDVTLTGHRNNPEHGRQDREGALAGQVHQRYDV